MQQLAKDTAAGQLHARSGLTLPVGLLLYLGISSTQQVRLMYREAARGFLAGDTAGKGLVDAKAAQESALGPQHGAEQLIALMLSQQKGSPYPSLTSIQVVRQVEADSPKEAKEQVVGQVGEEFSNQENSKVEQFPKEFPKEEDSKVVKHAEEESLLEGEDSRVENHYSTIEEDAHVGEDLPVHDAAQGAPPSSGSPTPEDAELN